jgi:hypothetical protein
MPYEDIRRDNSWRMAGSKVAERGHARVASARDSFLQIERLLYRRSCSALLAHLAYRGISTIWNSETRFPFRYFFLFILRTARARPLFSRSFCSSGARPLSLLPCGSPRSQGDSNYFHGRARKHCSPLAFAYVNKYILTAHS